MNVDDLKHEKTVMVPIDDYMKLLEMAKMQTKPDICLQDGVMRYLRNVASVLRRLNDITADKIANQLEQQAVIVPDLIWKEVMGTSLK